MSRLISVQAPALVPSNAGLPICTRFFAELAPATPRAGERASTSLVCAEHKTISSGCAPLEVHLVRDPTQTAAFTPSLALRAQAGALAAVWVVGLPLPTVVSQSLQRDLFASQVRLAAMFQHRGPHPIPQLYGCSKVAPLRLHGSADVHHDRATSRKPLVPAQDRARPSYRHRYDWGSSLRGNQEGTKPEA
jgi:hypothetical protein